MFTVAEWVRPRPKYSGARAGRPPRTTWHATDPPRPLGTSLVSGVAKIPAACQESLSLGLRTDVGPFCPSYYAQGGAKWRKLIHALWVPQRPSLAGVVGLALELAPLPGGTGMEDITNHDHNGLARSRCHGGRRERPHVRHRPRAL